MNAIGQHITRKNVRRFVLQTVVPAVIAYAAANGKDIGDIAVVGDVVAGVLTLVGI